MGAISKLLSTDGYIIVNKALIKRVGLNAAVLLGELCTEYNYWESAGELIDDMFYSTRENIEENTGLTDYMQREAMKILQNLQLLTVVKQGMPAKNYYKLDERQLLNFLTTSDKETEGQVIQNFKVNNNKVNSNNRKVDTNSKELVAQSASTQFSFGHTKSKKESLYTKCVSLIDDYTTDTNLRIALIDYLKLLLQMQKDGYQLYTNSWKGLLNKLDREFDSSERLAVVRQSLERGYKSFFPVSSAKLNSKNKDVLFAEEGVISEAYTKEELEELRKLDEERERNGLRTKF